MSKILLIIGLVLVGCIFSSCSLSVPEIAQTTANPECTPTPQVNEVVQNNKTEIHQSGKVEFKGVSFSYNPKVFGEIKSEEITEESPLESEDNKPGEDFPRHLSFSSDMKQPKLEKIGQEPRRAMIRVIPINDYRRMFAVSKNMTEWFDKELSSLRKVLINKNFRKRQAIYKGQDQIGFFEEMPFMYTYDSSQAFQQKVKQFSFQNGRGIFFLTEMQIEAGYINNQGLVYIFQGITSDEKYLVVAEFPVTVSFLPDGYMVREFEGYKIPDYFYGSEYEPNKKRYDKYISNIAKRLEKLPPEKYKPNLKYFEEIISTLKIGNEISGN